MGGGLAPERNPASVLVYYDDWRSVDVTNEDLFERQFKRDAVTSCCRLVTSYNYG